MRLYIQSSAAQHETISSAKRNDQWSILYYQSNSRTIFGWLRREFRSDGGLLSEDDEMDIQDQSTSLSEIAAKYLSGLQPVAINDLPADCRTCGICRETYNTGDETEGACLVGRCGHVLGRTCMSEWVMPKGRKANDTCPVCRAVLFEGNTSGPTNESGPTIFARSMEHVSEIIRRLGETMEEPRSETGQRILDLLTQIED